MLVINGGGGRVDGCVGNVQYHLQYLSRYISLHVVEGCVKCLWLCSRDRKRLLKL